VNVVGLIKNVSNRGFTLLEVMIAVALIAIALTTLLGSQSQSVSFANSAKFETMAALLAVVILAMNTQGMPGRLK
jgi:general secretion pathway protein I